VLLRIENLTKRYEASRWSAAASAITALKNVNLDVKRRESFGLVGESGSGKTTLIRCILGLEQLTSGRILFDGVDLATLSRAERRRVRARIQIVFQDPYAAINPRMTVHDIVAEPMVIHRHALGFDARRRSDRVREILGLVHMGEQHLHRFPHELSGGQRQRVGIARALAIEPALLLLDEPTSALDVSVQAQILNLLYELQEKFALTYLFISHDLSVIRYICDRVALIYLGEIVERGEPEQIFRHPQSDFARMLLSAVPDMDPDRSPYHSRS
jgi:ABC-type glutathione transport system ATPase component